MIFLGCYCNIDLKSRFSHCMPHAVSLTNCPVPRVLCCFRWLFSPELNNLWQIIMQVVYHATKAMVRFTCGWLWASMVVMLVLTFIAGPFLRLSDTLGVDDWTINEHITAKNKDAFANAKSQVVQSSKEISYRGYTSYRHYKHTRTEFKKLSSLCPAEHNHLLILRFVVILQSERARGMSQRAAWPGA